MSFPGDGRRRDERVERHPERTTERRRDSRDRGAPQGPPVLAVGFSMIFNGVLMGFNGIDWMDSRWGLNGC